MCRHVFERGTEDQLYSTCTLHGQYMYSTCIPLASVTVLLLLEYVHVHYMDSTCIVHVYH